MKNNKKVIMFICGLFILVSGFAYVNSDTIGGVLNNRNKETNVISMSSAKDGDDSTSIQKESSDISDKTDGSKKTTIAVYICGAVKNPGVYSFDEGSRVDDAVKAASGFKKGAAKTAINQARYLKDGEQITIPSLKQLKKKMKNKTSEEENEENTTDKDNEGLININTASATELMNLSGIGQSRAEAIVEYRKTNGNFSQISDIMKISGIKQGVFNKIKNKISV